MQFLLTTVAGDPPSEQVMAEMGKLIEELAGSGVLLATGGLEPAGTRVTSSGGQVTMADGASEPNANFALVEVPSRDEAVELMNRFWQIVGSGEGSIRQVYGQG